ncbi:unnamed protein product [Rotaria sordida]|uniref:EGF-like domain-containing protein n=2 Tax=Rotaria sordida TaxID=392033 RepID=A0A819HCT5_9BILA|nr:unnamed protein product [Rotaria sordida]CAF3896131.1 unnamed protein product [Rotaria sordida]
MTEFLIGIFVILTCLRHIESSNANEKAKVYEKVGHYLRNYQLKTKQADGNSDDYYLNSNKIGLGFNPLYGSPFCYTVACQMEGFGHPVFKLQYESSSAGACTNKLIPKFVSFDCLSSVVTSANTEIINTLDQLHESISNKIEVSVGASYGAFSFSYTNSKEIRYMVDNIVKNEMSLFYTSSHVSAVKLSMFEPFMELSDMFRFVIENLPCCDDDWQTEKYVRDYIFNYFGYTFVSTLLLGGIAQENIFMKRDSYQHLESQSISTRNAAKIAFYVSMGVSVENSQANSQLQEFMKQVQNSDATQLGGDPSVSDMNKWAKTVPSNSVITKFSIREIFDLLTKYRFPNDSQIQNKSTLIEKLLKKYIQQPLYCYNNCTSTLHGTCESSDYFQFGICKCKNSWTGINCSTYNSSTKPVVVYGSVLSGTLCGFDRAYIRKNCDGYRPWNGCPQGWISRSWVGADFTVCYKAVTSKNSSSIAGTLCGLYNFGGKEFVDILRNYTSDGKCPGYSRSGYSPVYSLSYVNGFLQSSNGFCMKSISSYPDLPGTLCGIQWAQTTDGPACDGYNPGLSHCPSGYAVQSWMLEPAKHFHLCAKL